MDDVTGAREVTRDLRELQRASKEAQGALQTDKTLVSSIGGLSGAGRSSISGVGASSTQHGINGFAEGALHFRHNAKDVGEVLEGAATGDLLKTVRGIRGLGLIGSGGISAVIAARAISTALERLSDIGDEYKRFYDVGSAMEKTQTTTGIRANAGDIRDIMSVQRAREISSLGGVDKYLQGALGRGLARDTVETLQSALGFELITPMKQVDEKAAERAKQSLEKAVDHIDKSFSAARLGNLADAESEDVKLISEVGRGFAKKVLTGIGSPAQRYYRWEEASKAARLWSALESPRAAQRSEED